MSLTVALAVLLIAVVAIVAVSAASNQNITSNIRVNFKPSQHVIGYVSATYQFGSTSRKMTTDGKDAGLLSDNDKITFIYAEKPTEKTLKMQSQDLKNGELVLCDAAREIVFTFTFENFGTSDFTAYLDLSRITTAKNISLSYSVDGDVYSSVLPEIKVEAGLLNKYERTLLSRLMQAKNMFCVDSKSIPVCRFVLANHYKLEKTILPWHRVSDIMHRKIVTSLATNCMHYVVLLV